MVTSTVAKGSQESAASIAPPLSQAAAALRDVDALTQEACSEIEAMARLVADCLRLDPHCLERARTACLGIASRAQALADGVNSLAEANGANWVDADEDAWRSNMWRQWHAMAEGKEARHG